MKRKALKRRSRRQSEIEDCAVSVKWVVQAHLTHVKVEGKRDNDLFYCNSPLHNKICKAQLHEAHSQLDDRFRHVAHLSDEAMRATNLQ